MNKECYGIVYCIENIINNKKYIGQTIQKLNRRIKMHFYESTYLHRTANRALYQAIRKYGQENFKSFVLATCNSKEELDEQEIYWIKYYNTLASGIGYNMTAGGQIEKKNHENKETSDALSQVYGGREFLVFDLKGNFVKSEVNQTVFAEEIGCGRPTVNNVLCGRKNQVKGYILIFKDKFSDELLEKKMNSRRKNKNFVGFDINDNYIGKWNSMAVCSNDLNIGEGYIASCLKNNNYHVRLTKYDQKFYYLESIPDDLKIKIIN